MKLTLSRLALDSSAATILALYGCTGGGGTTSPVKLSGVAAPLKDGQKHHGSTTTNI